jgi:DNA primase
MAGHIPRAFIDELLIRLDIVEVIHARVPLKKAGREYKACCPFHTEKTPSFTVSRSKQFYYCFGCGENGSVLSFLMEYENLDFVEAVESFASDLGLEVPRESQNHLNKSAQKKPHRDLYTLMEEVTEFYQLQLKSQPQAMEYLQQRNLDPRVIEQFQLGYAPEQWNRLETQFSPAYSQAQLLETGLLIQKEDTNNCYDRFRERITFPIRDKRGRVIGFGGRIMGDGQPKYLNSPETSLFNKGAELYGLYEARKSTRKLQRLLVVEGYMDVIALAQYKISYAVATLGTATTSTHIQQMFRTVSEVIFCFDGDRAGREAAWRAMENALALLGDDKEIRFLFLPTGEDPDTQIRKVKKEGFEQLIDSAVTLTDYMLDILQKKYNISTREGKAHLLNESAQLLAKLPTGLLKVQLLNTLEKLTNVSADIIEKHRTYADKRIEPTHASRSLSEGEVRLTPVRYAVALLLNEPNLAEEVENPEKMVLYPIKGINFLVKLLEIFEDSPNLTAANLIERFRGSKYEALLIILTKWHPRHSDIQILRQEFQDCLRHIRKMAHENQLESLLHKERVQGLSPQEKNDLKILLSEMH